MSANVDPGRYSRLYQTSLVESLWGDEPGSFVRKFVSGGCGGAYDLGCGDGRNLAWLSAMGYSAIGFDVDSLAVARAEKRLIDSSAHSKSKAHRRDVVSLSEMPAASVIVAYGLLHCVSDDSVTDVIEWICRHTIPGSRLVVAVLTDGIPEPDGHGTSTLFLRNHRFYRAAFEKRWQFDGYEVSRLIESHMPLIGEHQHEILRFSAERRI